jgi:hypothetical protein
LALLGFQLAKTVKEEIERLAREYGKLGEPWRFVAK